MVLKISGKRLILFQLQYLFVIKLITAIIPQLEILTYLSDAINLWILYYAFRNTHNTHNTHDTAYNWLVFIIMILLLFDIIMLFIRQQNFLLFLWGFRNQYRFILFTLASAKILSYKDLEEIIDVILKWFRINIPIVTIEYLLGYKMDFLGGTFGLERGCNAIVNIFLCVVTTIVVIYWMNGKMHTKNMALYLIFALYWAALSELKIFFIEFIIIIGLSIILVQGKESKKICIIGFSLLSVLIGINLLSIIFPYYSNFFNINSIIDYANNVNLGAAGFGRTTAISKIIDWFFDYDNSLMFLGMGTGSAEFSSISFLNSDIYKTFGLYQYFSYFHAFMFVERGYFGLFWYLTFFGSSILIAFKKMKITKMAWPVFLQISIITSICSIITMIYDIGLRTSTSGYLAFLLCAIPYIKTKSNRKHDVF